MDNLSCKKIKKVPDIYQSGQFRDSCAAGVTTEQSRLPIIYDTDNDGKSQVKRKIWARRKDEIKKVPEIRPLGALSQRVATGINARKAV